MNILENSTTSKLCKRLSIDFPGHTFELSEDSVCRGEELILVIDKRLVPIFTDTEEIDKFDEKDYSEYFKPEVEKYERDYK